MKEVFLRGLGQAGELYIKGEFQLSAINGTPLLDRIRTRLLTCLSSIDESGGRLMEDVLSVSHESQNQQVQNFFIQLAVHDAPFQRGLSYFYQERFKVGMEDAVTIYAGSILADAKSIILQSHHGKRKSSRRRR